MFKELRLPLRKVRAIYAGIELIESAADSATEILQAYRGKMEDLKYEPNILPRKLAMKLGMQKDELEQYVRSYRKQTKEMADEVFAKYLKKETLEELKKDEQAQMDPSLAAFIMKEIERESEALLDDPKTDLDVKVLKTPIKETEFEDFLVPAKAFAMLRPILDLKT